MPLHRSPSRDAGVRALHAVAGRAGRRPWPRAARRCACRRIAPARDGRKIDLRDGLGAEHARSAPRPDPVVHARRRPGPVGARIVSDRRPRVPRHPAPARRDPRRPARHRPVAARCACPGTPNDAGAELETVRRRRGAPADAACLREIERRRPALLHDQRRTSPTSRPCARRSVSRSSTWSAFPTARAWRSSTCAAIPRRTRTVVLDSRRAATLVLGAEHARNLEAAVDAQFARCAADAACRERFGSPRARLDELLAAAARSSRSTVTYRDPLTNELREDELTADARRLASCGCYAYAPQLFGMLPMLLAEAADGRYESADGAGAHDGAAGRRADLGGAAAVRQCAEDAPGCAPTRPTRARCSAPRSSTCCWRNARSGRADAVPADFHAPVAVRRARCCCCRASSIRSRRRATATRSQRTLPNSRHLVLRGQGHSVMRRRLRAAADGRLHRRGRRAGARRARASTSCTVLAAVRRLVRLGSVTGAGRHDPRRGAAQDVSRPAAAWCRPSTA